MPRPIQPTPTLRGKDAERLLRDLADVCSPAEAQRRIAYARQQLAKERGEEVMSVQVCENYPRCQRSFTFADGDPQKFCFRCGLEGEVKMEQKFVDREKRYALLQKLVAVADADKYDQDVQEIRKGLLLQLADAARALAEHPSLDQ